MGATYTRQSSAGITDGAVIEASDLNNEFDQLLAAFVAASGHTHDGTAAEGGPVTKLLGTAITIGDGTAGTDIAVTFDGETGDGVLTWMEDEDYFKFSDEVLMNSTEKLLFGDTGTYIHQSADGVLDLVSDTEIEINATTIDINGAVAMDGAITGATNITLSGELDAATLDISGNADIDGTTNLDIVDIDGAVQLDSTLTVGADDQGYDIKFFGDTASAYMLWDTSADDLVLAGAAGIDLAGDIDVDGTANLDAVDIDGAVQIDNTVTVGVNDTGYDVKFFGATSGAYMLWDESTDDLVLAGAAKLYLYDAAGGEYLSSSGSALTIASGGTAWELPTSDGSANQLLKTDGSGNLDWTTVVGTITALNNATANELVTVGATTTELDAEANLTFDGTTLTTTALAVDDVAVDGKVVTMTGSASDTAVFTAGTNGTLSIVTTDAAAAAANIQITADGTVDIDSAGVLTLDSGAAINIEPASGSAILLDGTISVDAGVVTGATSITSTAFVGDITGDVTGNTSGTAATVTTAAQTNITSLGTLTALTVDDVAINGKVVTMTGSTSDTAVLTAGTNGTLSIVTTDAAAAAANMTLTADGTFEADGTTVTLDSAGDIILDAGGADVFLKDDGTLFGTLTQSGGELVIKSSSSGTTALTFSGANATFAGTLATAAGGFNVAGLDIDGATDIGADIVDADLFIIDDGAGGTNRKTTAARVKTYIGGGTSWQAVKTGAFTAVAGEGYFVNTTSSAFTMTLPASPTIGDEVAFIDYAGTFDTNNLTVGRNSENIQGSAADLTVSTERAANTLVYTDGTQGWLLKVK